MSELERHQVFPVRLCTSIRQHAARIAEDNGISLNYFIVTAIHEKLSALKTEDPAQAE